MQQSHLNLFSGTRTPLSHRRAAHEVGFRVRPGKDSQAGGKGARQRRHKGEQAGKSSGLRSGSLSRSLDWEGAGLERLRPSWEELDL